jgi:hypothetical protein
MGLVTLPGGTNDPVLVGGHSVPDFEQEIVDQSALTMAAAGLSDGHIRHTRAVVIEFARTLTVPLRKATSTDAFCAAGISGSIAVGRRSCCTPGARRRRPHWASAVAGAEEPRESRRVH